MNWQNVSRNN
jgi:hypothetical protein